MSIENRYDFVYLFDVKDGNPNGDPDAGNMPRVDPETGQGLVTDVCLKRKVRNFVEISKPKDGGFSIFIREKAILNNLIDEAHEQNEVKDAGQGEDKDKKKGKDKVQKVEAARRWMCKQYYDIRTFGAVMSTGKNAGQVRGPIQITFSRSIDPIVAMDYTITRMAVTKPEDAKKERTMGKKATVLYGLYRCHGFISAHLAAQTGFSESDLELFWDALQSMFDHDRSAARGEMTARGIYVFKHLSKLGNHSAFDLLDRVAVSKIESSVSTPPRTFSDYKVVIDTNMPNGVEFVRKFG